MHYSYDPVVFSRCCDLWGHVAWWPGESARPFGKALNKSFRFHVWLIYQLLLCTWTILKRTGGKGRGISSAVVTGGAANLPSVCAGFFFFPFKKKTNFFSNNTWNLHKIWNFWCNDERINLVWNYLSPLFKFFHDWYVCVLLQPRCILLVFIAYNHFIFEMVYVLYIGEIVSFLETNFSIVKW